MNETPDRDREENNRLLRLLEAATSPRDGVEPSRHVDRDEYSGLRAAWLAFGQLLDAAADAHTIDIRSVSEAIEPALANEKHQLLPGSRVDRKSSRLRRLATVAAACGILLAVGSLGLKWCFDHAGRQPNQALPVADQTRQPNAQPRLNAPKAPAPTLAQSEKHVNRNNTTSPKQSRTRAKTSTWDDAIDEQIASVSQEIESVRHTWRHRVVDVDLVQYRVDEVSAGLTKDAL